MNTRAPRLLHQFGAHDEVLIKEVAWSRAVRANAADHRCKMDDRLWTRVSEAVRDLDRIGKVVLRMHRRYHVLIATFAQFGQDLATKKARATGDQHARLMFGRVRERHSHSSYTLMVLQS